MGGQKYSSPSIAYDIELKNIKKHPFLPPFFDPKNRVSYAIEGEICFIKKVP